jgi:hypothetical protein
LEVTVAATPHAVQSEGREAVYLLWKKAAERKAEFANRSEAVGLLRDCLEDPEFLELAARKIRERNP